MILKNCFGKCKSGRCENMRCTCKEATNNCSERCQCIDCSTFAHSWTIWTKMNKLSVKVILAIQIFSSNDVYTFSYIPVYTLKHNDKPQKTVSTSKACVDFHVDSEQYGCRFGACFLLKIELWKLEFFIIQNLNVTTNNKSKKQLIEVCYAPRVPQAKNIHCYKLTVFSIMVLWLSSGIMAFCQSLINCIL